MKRVLSGLMAYAEMIRKGIMLFSAKKRAAGGSMIRYQQRKRLISLILCVAMISSYIPDIDVAKAESTSNPVLAEEQVVLNGQPVMQLGEVTYRVADGETGVSLLELNETASSIRVKTGDEISFAGVISAPEGETISWVRVDVYDAAAEEPYAVGEEYYYVRNLNVQQYDLANIPVMTIGETFGDMDYALTEGGQYIVMLYAADSAGNVFEDVDTVVDGDQGPAVLMTVKMSPANCKHPHAHYQYVLHDSGKIRRHNYGDSLVHQVEPLYERYCGLCDRYLMNIWGQGTPEEHEMEKGACSVCGYIEGSALYVELPMIQSIICSAGEVFTAGTEVTFTTVASAETGLSEIALYIDDELRLSEDATGTVDSLKCTINDLAIGEHMVKATVVDQDGWYNEASYTVMVLQADFATCAHVNTSVQQTTQYVADENGELQPITVDVVHCLDCATDLYANEPLMTLDDNAADYVYTAKDGKATITEYIGTETNVIVPETINGYTVTVIDEWAFSYTSAVSVTLSDTIESVEAYAFAGYNLREIRVNKNAWVDQEAFLDCSNNTIIYGYSGSSAELAAAAAGLEFVSVGNLVAAPTLTVEPGTVAYGEEYHWSVLHPNTDTIWIQRICETEYGEKIIYRLYEYEAGGYLQTADAFAENYTETITAKVLIDGDWSAIAQVQVKVICESGASEDYEYAITNGTAQIKRYLGNDTNVIIPSEIDGYTVTSIGDSAFYGTDVVSVTFPSTLEMLGGGVFYNCKYLKSIYTNKKLLVEDEYSFSGCEGATVYGYSGGSVENAARLAGCGFVSLGILSSDVPKLTVTPKMVVYGDEYEIMCELKGADMFQIHATFVSASESYTYSMIDSAIDGFASFVWEASIHDGAPANFTETYKVCACVNGEWTQYSEPQTVTVIADGSVLPAPVIHEIESPVSVHQDLIVSWDLVENAEEYEVWIWPITEVHGGGYEIETPTPDATEIVIPADRLYTYFYGTDLDEIELRVEVKAKAERFSSSVSEAQFTAFIYTLGTPEIEGLPETIVPGAHVTVTWPPVEHSEKAETYYEFYLVDQNGNQEMINFFTEDGEDEHICTLSFSRNLPEGDYTLLVKASALGMGVRDSSFEHSVKVVQTFEYTVIDGKAVITGYHGEDKSITVPASIDGYPVVKIGDGAFEGNTTITDVRLPDSVTEIGARAFKNCTALKSIYGPGVTSIGEEAFYGCINLTNVQFYQYIYYIGNNAFYAVDLPNYTQPLTVYVRAGESTSFEGNTVIGKVVYPEGVTEIPARTHYTNTRLNEVFLPTTLETIGSQAFAACGELSYVKLYDGITSIADDAFADSPKTVLYIYVKDMETVSYVEQYAIENAIEYRKILYTTDGVVTPTVSVSSQVGGGVIDVQENEAWVKVNEEIILGAAGHSAETAHFYLNDELVGEYEFESAVIEIPYTFTVPGDVTFYAKTYSGKELVETSQTLIIHVVGVALTVDKENPWTCEPVHFELTVANFSGTASVYADDAYLLDVSVVDGNAQWDYAFRKAGERTIRVVADGLEPIEKSIMVRCVDKLGVPVITAEAEQRLTDGLTISWDAIDHADGYVVRVVNTADEIFLEQEVEASDKLTITHTIEESKLQGAGTYAVFVMAYGYQYDQSQSDSVNVNMVDKQPVYFTVSKTQVQTGEDVSFTVYADDATLAEFIVDGEAIETYAMNNGTLTFVRPFSKAGERKVTFRVMIDGEWTDPCTEQTVVVTSAGQLTCPQPTTNEYHLLGSSVSVTWPDVEHAEGYILRVWDPNGNEIYSVDTAEKIVTIPSEVFESSGYHSISVMAYGTGYSQSESEAITTRMIGTGDIIFTVDKTRVQTGEDVTFTVYAVHADQVELIVDGTVIETYAMDNDVLTFVRPFSKSGERAVAFRARIDGEWTALCEEKIITVASAGQLDKPEPTTKQQHLLGSAVDVTWAAIEHADGYVIRVFDASGNEVYYNDITETAVTIPSETFVSCTHYSISVMAYGDGYDQSEGGTTTEIVEQLELGVTVTAEPNPAYEKTYVTVTVMVDQAQSSAVLMDANGEIYTQDMDLSGEGIFIFNKVTEAVQGDYVYTAIVNGTEELAGATQVRKSITITYLDANAPVIREITATPDASWPGEKVAFEINANAMTQRVRIQLLQKEEILEEYDLLSDKPDVHIFSWSYDFTTAGTYTLLVTPINEDNENGEAFEMSYTVLAVGQLPDPVITNPKNGAIETDEGVNVTWDAVVLSQEMAFGGYCILLEKQNEQGEYAAVSGYICVSEDETNYTLTGLEPGGQYKLHLFTLEKDHIEPNGSLHGEAVVEFSYRTVPAFTMNSVIGGAKGEAITAEWTAPVWDGANIKPDFYVVYWIGPDGETIETQTVRNDTKSILGGDKVVQEGCYSVDVYACMYESWGEYPQAHAVVSGSYVIGTPEVIITHPTVDQNTYLITEDFIEVLGEVKGGIRQVLARILDRDGNPIDLISYGDGSIVKHVIVQPDANGKFCVKLNMKDFFAESDGDETRYCVQVLGFISPDEPVIEKYDCEAKCWINTDGSEINNLKVNGYSNYCWLFNDQSMKATVKTNALPQSVRFCVNGELKFTDENGAVQKDTSKLFETEYFSISKEGYYEVTASTHDGKEIGPVGVYVVTRTARETKYYNDTTKLLNVLSRPVIGAQNKISPIAAPCEMIKVGTYGKFTAVEVNGVTGFVLTNELSDTVEEPIPNWSFEIEEKTNDTYLWIEGNPLVLSGEYVLIARWEENGTPKLRMADDKSMRIMGDTYKRRFRLSEDLCLKKDKLYEFEVVPRTADGTVKLNAAEYSFSYYYGENTGIITPREGQRVRMWNTGALTIQWIRDEDAQTYEVELIFVYEHDGKEVTQSVYNSGKLDAKKQKYEYNNGKDIHTLVLYTDKDGLRDKVPQEVWNDKEIRATVVLTME